MNGNPSFLLAFLFGTAIERGTQSGGLVSAARSLDLSRFLSSLASFRWLFPGAGAGSVCVLLKRWMDGLTGHIKLLLSLFECVSV